MLSNESKALLRMVIEKDLYDAIFESSDGYGLEGIDFMLEESPNVLNEIIKKHKETVHEAAINSINYEFTRS
jgi:hypothetical protein